MKHVFSRNLINFFHSCGSSYLLTPVNENMKENQCYSWRNGKPMWLLVATAPKPSCGNRCAFLPLCLSPGARLHAEADAPSQRKRGGCWWSGRSGRTGGRCVPSTALPPTYCHAQQYLPTSVTVSAGKKQHYISENHCRIPSLVYWNHMMWSFLSPQQFEKFHKKIINEREKFPC